MIPAKFLILSENLRKKPAKNAKMRNAQNSQKPLETQPNTPIHTFLILHEILQ